MRIRCVRRCSFPPLPSLACSSSSRYSLPALLRFHRRGVSSPKLTNHLMAKEILLSSQRKFATSRLCNVSSFSTELIELHSDEPLLHMLFIPGNPGIVTFYKEFIEAVYELLEGNVSITAISHISHTIKNWENGRTFSLQDQINHKVDFINQELQNSEIPIVMVGHSIGSYICLEVFKRLPQQVVNNFYEKFYEIRAPVSCLVSPDKSSVHVNMHFWLPGQIHYWVISIFDLEQGFLKTVYNRSPALSVTISSLLASLGLLPVWVTNALVRRSLGQSWSSTAVEATCTHLLQYHTMRNVLFMAMTEFEKLSEEPNWTFMRTKQDQIALLFGVDDHWGPLSLFEEVSRQAPDIALSVEREGHTHAFCCTEAGSLWVAHHVVSLIKNRILH